MLKQMFMITVLVSILSTPFGRPGLSCRASRVFVKWIAV